MKIGRNDLCPCGSDKKYKHCCLKKQTVDDNELIKNIIKKENYDELLGQFICNLYDYMKENQWIGACHATCSIMYVGLCELGYNPQLYIGEVGAPNFIFDHSWIVLDGKIIDLAVAMSLQGGLPVSNPIIFDKDLYSLNLYSLNYGIAGNGLDMQAKIFEQMNFIEYMNLFPNYEDGLWEILKKVYPKEINTENIKHKYNNVEKKYIN